MNNAFEVGSLLAVAGLQKAAQKHKRWKDEAVAAIQKAAHLAALIGPGKSRQVLRAEYRADALRHVNVAFITEAGDENRPVFSLPRLERRRLARGYAARWFKERLRSQKGFA